MGSNVELEGIFKHQCEEPGCDRIVIYDDEPMCFEHSPDSGSSLRGYSAKRSAEVKALERLGIRTQVDFKDRHGRFLRTVRTTHVIPNVAVGQIFVFDHPTIAHVLGGTVTNIQHTVFLGNEAPLTYIDVEVTR